MGKFYTTTPIYYVNDAPHIGHAYTTVAADVLARFHRQLGDDVFFLTGTDEHGSKVAQAAQKRGISPRQHADDMVGKFRDVTERVNATNDFFIRTTDPDHGTLPAYMEEENYFFRLSAYQDRLAEHYRANPDFVRPAHRYNEALSFIDQGLEDISISRATLNWGIPVPWDEEQVIYVWVDALINYLSALTYAGDEDLRDRFWPADYHIMAQDILKFHGIIWPALLMSAEHELPEHLFIHGYLKLGGEKMSKTRGNVMDPFPLIEEYGADPFRFYCFREVNFGQDGLVSEDGFKSRYNAELANEFGNLVSRTLSMIGKYRDSRIPDPQGQENHGAGLAGAAEDSVKEVRKRMDEVDLSGALDSIWDLVRRLNRYVEEQAPWKMAKSGDDVALDRTLWDLAEGIRLLAVVLHPFIPAATEETMRRLGLGESEDALMWSEAVWGRLPADNVEEIGPPLFPRIED